jgi:hypothetical protein
MLLLLTMCVHSTTATATTTTNNFQAVHSDEAIISQDELNFDKNCALDPGIGLFTTSTEVLELYKNASSSVAFKYKPALLSIRLHLGGKTSRALQPFMTDAMKCHLDYEQAIIAPAFIVYDTKMA